jgi:hypothetical protein
LRFLISRYVTATLVGNGEAGGQVEQTGPMVSLHESAAFVGQAFYYRVPIVSSSEERVGKNRGYLLPTTHRRHRR